MHALVLRAVVGHERSRSRGARRPLRQDSNGAFEGSSTKGARLPYSLALLAGVVLGAGCVDAVGPGALADGDCVGPACHDADAHRGGDPARDSGGGLPEDTAEPDPRDASDPRRDTGDAGGDVDAEDAESGTVDGRDLFDDPAPDIPDVPDGGARIDSLFVVCERDSDCAFGGTACVKEWTIEDADPAATARSVRVADVFPARVRPGQGVCTLASGTCVRGGDAECASLEPIDGVPWACMVVWSEDRYATRVGGDLGGDGAGLQASLRAGDPWVATCRPPLHVLRGLGPVGEACPESGCGTGSICADPGAAFGADREQARVCLPACGLDEDCPAGLDCQRFDGQAHGVCAPAEGTFGACRDLDADGFGAGRCAGADGASAVDCDDLDPAVFHDPARDPATLVCVERDANCDGVRDDLQLVGPDGLAPPLHCGGCDVPCDASALGDGAADLPNGAAVCRAGLDGAGVCELGCAEGWASCDGATETGCETRLGTDADCRTCGDACWVAEAGVASARCSIDALEGEGVCVLEACEEGRADCDGVFASGCEVDLAGDDRHCGACGVACATELPQGEGGCRGGLCAVVACDDEFADCDGAVATGCESNLREDLANCGSCGVRCLDAPEVADATCAAGACVVVACTEGYGDCDAAADNGCEVDLRTSSAHCGSCGLDCAALPHVAEAVCTGGGCEIRACVAGWEDCDGDPANGCERSIATADDCGACDRACAADAWPEPLAGACGPVDGGFGCVCVEPEGTSRQLCDGRPTRCGEGVDAGCPGAVDVRRAGLRTRATGLCDGCASTLPMLNTTTCRVIGGTGEQLRSAGTCARCDACVGTSSHCCPDDAATMGLLSHVEVAFVNDPRRDPDLGPEVNHLAFSWFAGPVPVEPDGAVDSTGNWSGYRLALAAVPTVRRGSFGRSAPQPGARTEVLRCDADQGELVTGLGFFLDEDARIKGLAIQCRSFALRNLSPGQLLPSARYRAVAAGSAHWVLTPGYTVDQLPLGSTEAHRTLDPWTGASVLNRVVFGSSSTNSRAHAGAVPLAGGVRAVVGTRASGPVPAAESFRFDWFQVGYTDLLTSFVIQPIGE